MIDYRTLGFISEKQHTVCSLDNNMLVEHVITREGFNDHYSILYQKRAPTHETKVQKYKTENQFFPSVVKSSPKNLSRQHFQTSKYSKSGNLLESRATLLANDDVTVGIANLSKSDDHFLCNSDGDEIFFVNEGTGSLETIMGVLEYGPLDYLIVPKSIPYRFKINSETKLLAVEGKSQTGVPKEFRNLTGQIKLDAPYNHRDFRSPKRLLEIGKNENPSIVVKRFNELTLHEYTDFPYNVVGWDGWYWPCAFNVENYQPRTSSIHLPPSVHAAFAGNKFYIMNFVPRLVDYHPKAVPCPWPHSNIDCDEVLFYVKGDFTSRKGISQYSMSFHPAGIPHGPHPEKYEKSLGMTRTDELAIMVDTFAPLYTTEAACAVEDHEYHYSWNTKEFL